MLWNTFKSTRFMPFLHEACVVKGLANQGNIARMHMFHKFCSVLTTIVADTIFFCCGFAPTLFHSVSRFSFSFLLWLFVFAFLA